MFVFKSQIWMEFLKKNVYGQSTAFQFLGKAALQMKNITSKFFNTSSLNILLRKERLTYLILNPKLLHIFFSICKKKHSLPSPSQSCPVSRNYSCCRIIRC